MKTLREKLGPLLLPVTGVALLSLTLVFGLPLAWLVASLGMLMAALVMLLAMIFRMPHPVRDRMEEEGRVTLMMPIESTRGEAWTPVEALQVENDCFVVTQSPMPGERWAFDRGLALRCESRFVEGEQRLVPTEVEQSSFVRTIQSITATVASR